MFITDRAQFDLFVNGINMQVGAELLQEAWVIEHVHTTKPSVKVSFIDNKQAAASWGALQDGAPIEVTMGDGRAPPRTWKFRQYAIDGIAPRSGGDLISLSGVADVVPFLTSVVRGVHKGNASDVLTQLAQKFGVPRIDIAGTQDRMNWMPDLRTVSQFARKVVDHAYMGEGACPVMALTSEAGEWMLRLRDIMQKGDGGIEFTSAGLPGAGTDPSRPMVYDHLIKSHGGALNSFANYGLKLVTNNLSGSVSDLLGIDINALAGFVGINSQLASAVGIARTVLAPASHGNTHEKYWEAFHANTKMRATFSGEISTLLQEMTDTRVLDDVVARLANGFGQEDVAYSGPAKISGITRGIQRGTYVERHTHTNQGTNSSAGGDQ